MSIERNKKWIGEAFNTAEKLEREALNSTLKKPLLPTGKRDWKAVANDLHTHYERILEARGKSWEDVKKGIENRKGKNKSGLPHLEELEGKNENVSLLAQAEQKTIDGFINLIRGKIERERILKAIPKNKRENFGMLIKNLR